jgi:carbamoyl-phosphate synthase small subunit
MAFEGMSPKWQNGTFEGEVVFTTGMTGYDASLTDPSYAGQILVFTYPLLGNYGIPPHALWESERIYASGVVVCNACTHWSHGKSTQSLYDWLELQKVPMISGVDTRHLTKILREHGTMLGAISSSKDIPSLIADPNLASLADRVSISKQISYGEKGKKIIAVDCGMKSNILRNLLKYPLRVQRVPYNYDYTDDDYDGIFISNGPGNPENYIETIAVLSKAMKKQKPIFGICLGAQLLSLAAGAKIYKLPYGHRSHNQPCIDLQTKRCYITSQNHGYAIREETLPHGWKVNFRNINDGTVEGIKHTSLPFSAVQFHPEASPGPTDTQWLFNQFITSL